MPLMIAPRSSTVAALRAPPARCNAASASSTLSTPTTRTSPAPRRASATSAFGTIMSCTPFVRAVIAFCSTPPTSPTVPSAAMVPVTATRLPPVRLARREVVDDREREREAGRRPADALRC